MRRAIFHPFSSPHPDHLGFLSSSQYLISDRLFDGRLVGVSLLVLGKVPIILLEIRFEEGRWIA